jgi:hypothetical protein
MMAEVLLRLQENIPDGPRYPAIDAHNHLFGNLSPERLLGVMDEVGVATFLNVSGNVSLPFGDRGYRIERRDIAPYIDSYCKTFPGRFAAFTMSDFALWDDFLLFGEDGSAERFVDTCIQHLEADIRRGAKGLKVTKELGLHFQDGAGTIIPVNDSRLYPIWQRAGELGLPVLIHTSDPMGFFLPKDESNEHFATLKEFPGWSFSGSFFSKQQLLEQRNRMIADHPLTHFICPHVANHAEDLVSVGRFLDRFANVSIDFSARMDELGRQPYTSRDFMIRYQDRILFGTDMPVSGRMYRCYFRFLETADECFEYPDYMGRWGHSRWKIYGLKLPDAVLKKIYRENVLQILPGIEET